MGIALDGWAKIAASTVAGIAILWRLVVYFDPLYNRRLVREQHDLILRLQKSLEERVREIDSLNRVIRLGSFREESE